MGTFDPEFANFDQSLNRCNKCGHIQLGRQVDPAFLYSNDSYVFESQSSPKYQAEYDFLARFLRDAIGSSELGRVLEFGANNLALADFLKSQTIEYTVCDPLIDTHKEHHGVVTCIPLLIEEALDGHLDSQFDLILARHTLEHIENPLVLLRRLLRCVPTGGILAFEVPSLEHLLMKYRFDAVTHQHLHYFSIPSIQTLAQHSGSELILSRYNPRGSNGGSLLFALRKNSQPRIPDSKPHESYSKAQIQGFIRRFEAQCAVFTDSIDWHAGSTLGFGASLMLATVNYHLRGVVEGLGTILDDDPNRDGGGYKNLNVVVKTLGPSYDLSSTTLVVTSWENGRQISSRLSDLGANRILSPLIT